MRSVRWVHGALASLMLSAALGASAQAQSPQALPPPQAVGLGAAQGSLTLMPAYVSLRAIALMPETGQAMLWDEARREYAVLRVGEERDGWRLVAVEKSRAVVVQAAGVREELKLVPAPTEISAAPPPRGKKRSATFFVEPDRAVEATPELAAGPTPPSAVGLMAALEGRSAPVQPTLETRNVKRAEFDREIGNFDRLLDQVTVAPAVGGGVVLQRMKSSFLGKLGLKEGDVVRTVAGEQVSTVESAARVYAQLRSAKTFMVELDRAGVRVLLRCDLG